MLVYPAHDYRGQSHSDLGRERQANPRLRTTSRQEYVRWLSALAASAPEWMMEVIEANSTCTQDPKAAWIPVDLASCEMKGPLTLGVDGQPVRTIAVEEARERIETEQAGVLVLDMRHDDEYIGELGHIHGSLLIPVEDLAQRLDELEPYRGREIITVCRGGGRSHTGAGILMQAGFANVASMADGMTGWNQRGYPVTREAR